MIRIEIFLIIFISNPPESTFAEEGTRGIFLRYSSNPNPPRIARENEVNIRYFSGYLKELKKGKVL